MPPAWAAGHRVSWDGIEIAGWASTATEFEPQVGPGWDPGGMQERRGETPEVT